MNGFPSDYNFSCGAVKRWENKDFWVEIYKEHGVYHVRRGKINGKWFEWKTYDNTIPSFFGAAKKKFKGLVRLSEFESKEMELKNEISN